MTAKTDLIQKSVKQFEAFEKTLNGKSNSEFHQKRKRALKNLETLGLPHRKTENYKYTPITNRLKRQFDLDFEIKPATALDKSQLEDLIIPNLDAFNLVMVNGKFSQELSTSDFPKGIEVLDLDAAYSNHQDLLDKHFGNYAKDESDAFTALNTAFANDGMFIHIHPNQVIKKPIVIYNISDDRAGQSALQPRHLMLAEQNSQATVIEEYIQIGDLPSFTNTVNEVVVHKDAIFNYYKLELRCDQAYHVGNTHIVQTASSTVNASTITLSGKLIRNNLNIILDDEHCEANMHGLYLLSGDQHVDNQTMVDHRKPNSYSNELYKGIIDKQATGVFNGKIYVRQDAQKTNAFQSNNNILLSDEATINTKPQLEIWADDVKCSHGATTGQLDKEQMFYLQSRGIGKEEARSMLLYAFAMEVLENIKIEAVKNFIDHQIEKRLK